MPRWTVRPAVPGDVAGMDALVRQLAAYEREPDAVEATASDLAGALFRPHPHVAAHVAEVTGADGEPELAGVAIWFLTWSTWRGRHGIWLEDLFVRPEDRGLGIGRGLMAALASECVAQGYRRLEWSVLDWNEPAHGFYRMLGATPLEAWTTWRLDGDALDALSGR